MTSKPRHRVVQFVLLLVLPLIVTAFPVSARDRLAIMDLRAKEGITDREAESITGLLRTEVFKLNRYYLVNREDMKAIATNAEIELRICDEDQCLVKLGMALNAQHVIAGDIGKVFGSIMINLRMVNIDSEVLRNTHDVAVTR